MKLPLVVLRRAVWLEVERQLSQAETDRQQLRRQVHELTADAGVARATAQERGEAIMDLKRVILAMDSQTAVAKTVVDGQARHIEQLTASNDKLVMMMTEMRRAGFGLLDDILKEDHPPPSSVADDDAAVLKTNPELVADDEW